MKTRAIFLGDDANLMWQVWGPEQRARLRKLADIPERMFTSPMLADGHEAVQEAEVAFSTWGMPSLNAEQLTALPNLRAVFFAAGSVKDFAPAFFERDITVVSAWVANAVPVAEYAVSQILFAMKLGWSHVRQLRQTPTAKGWRRLDIPGAYGSTVGLVSLGMIGRRTAEMLRPFSLHKLAYDPFVDEEEMGLLGVHPASLEEIFERSQVVSLHCPALPETADLIDGSLIRRMRPDATLINTARGSLINEEEMCEALRARPDLTAVLDVVKMEPPRDDSPLYRLPNVVMTPHIAGSLGNETRRMADWMIDEFMAWEAGSPLRYAISPGRLKILA